MKKYTFWRLIALGCATFITLCFALCTFAIHEEDRLYYLYSLIPVGLFMIYSIIHQMRFPLDLRLYILWVLLFSFMGTAYGSTALGVLLWVCAYFLGLKINFFKNNKALKYSLICFCYVVAILMIFRLDKRGIIDSLSELAVAGVAVLWMRLVIKHVLKRISQDVFVEMQREDINDYFGQYNFTERDKKMLEEVLAGCKYEEIAINHNLSLSSVKKRLAFLYKILGVTCQIDFIIKFSGKDSTKV